MNEATRTDPSGDEGSDQRSIEELEAMVPTLALQALREARESTLAAGISVVWSDGASLWETAPDGTRRLLGADAPIRPRFGEP
ncbi:MAG: hypothetical protein KGS10_19190 [Chloroflexi bacterium]|jgi:hypothetical protein|nr:hypothetical protein [Chloroflexota bacterium]